MNWKIKLGKAIQALTVLVGIILILIALWLFAIDRYNPSTGLYFDGLGRRLYHWGQGVHGRDELSPGLLWEVADTAVAILLFGVISGAFSIGRRLKRQGEIEESQKEKNLPTSS